MKKRFGRFICFLFVMILGLCAAYTVSAATYESVMNSGDHYTLRVGDILYLTNPAPTSNMVFKAYGWSVGNNCVELTSTNSRVVGVKAVRPGSTSVYSELTGSIEIRKPISGGDPDDYYITYQSYTYPYKVWIDIIDEEPPTITKQPANACAASGGTVKTSVSATDTSGLSYQWYIKDPGASKFTKSSVTGATYSYTMTSAKSGRQVYCVVTDDSGNSTKSKTATLSLLAITKQPADVYVKNGTIASTTLKASGSGLKYTWYVKDPGASSYVKSSNTSATYSFTMTSAKSRRQVYCKVTDKYGNTVTSKTATLKIIETAKITKHPTKAFTSSGKTVSATVKATGDGIKYQWYIKDPGNVSFSKSSVTGTKYSCTMTAAKSGRQVYCVVTDRYGNKQKSSTVTLAMLQITKQPTNQMGKTVATKVTAKGDGLRYQWYVKDVSDSSYKISAITSSTYSVTLTAGKTGRQVYCKITDKYGNSIKTNVVTLKMLAITKQPQDASGEQVSTSVGAFGEGLSYQWYYKDPGMSSYQKSSATKSVYSCTMTESKSGRQVYCKVTDKHGSSVSSEPATLYVLKITQQPVNTCGAKNQAVQANVTAVGEGLTYTWYSTTDLDSDQFSMYSQSDNGSYQTWLGALSQSSGGRKAYCVITDKLGNSVTSNTIVLAKLGIDSWTTSQTVNLNATYTIYVDAYGTGLTYRWFVADPDFPEYQEFPQSNSRFQLQGKYVCGYMSYYCLVTDQFGNQVLSPEIRMTSR